ncbi:MAG: hypothetical protein N3A69_04250 [Leptospiraceae bacterium]|nr:hypothetical protein [Leptospiraceae bacterium]
MKKILTLFFWFATSLFSEKVVLPVAYFLDVSNYTWKGPAQITLQNERIQEISFVKNFQKSPYYITPSFCDAQVTLSLNALGGANNKQDLHEILETYKQHGITNILSSFDPPWVKSYYFELKKKNNNLPNVYFSERPILFKTREYEDLPREIYFVSESFPEIQKEIRKQQLSHLPILLLHRYFPQNTYYFTSEQLFKLKRDFKTGILSVGTFANKQSVLDSLKAEIQYLQHPISIEWNSEISSEHKRNLKLLPLLNVYRNLFLIQNQTLESELEQLNSRSKYFSKKIFSRAKDSFSQLSLQEEEKVPFDNYIQFISENPSIHKNLILGSGAGNLYSFHAISTLQELNLFREAIRNNLFLKSGIENSCKYMGINNNRSIHVGNSIDLILFKKNPTESIEGLFSIEKTYSISKISSFD